MKKNILVTGGTGAIGSNLVKRLIELDDFDKLVILDNNSSGHKDNIEVGGKIVYIDGDITDDKVLEEAFSHDITHVYHLAANFANQSSVDYPVKDLNTNGIGIVKLLEKCKAHGVEKVLYTSSSCVYDPATARFTETSPLLVSTPYSITKLLSEYYVSFFNKYHGLNAVILRIFSNYGPGDYPGKFRSVIPNFIHAAMKGEPLTITGTGEETRPFTFVGDVVDGAIAAMERSPEKKLESYYTHPIKEEDNLIYNIGTENITSLTDLANKINKLCGEKSEIVYVPRRDWDVVAHRTVDTSKAKKELDFVANTSIDDGLEQTVAWFKSESFNPKNIKE